MEELSVKNNFTAVPDLNLAGVKEVSAETLASHLYVVQYPYPAVSSPLDHSMNGVSKRGFDIIVSAILITAVLSWLIPLLAIIIKLDSHGPVFFRQKRKRNGGRLFNCLKFRSMIVNDDADNILSGENDSRITKVGRILRKYHLDELPQLFNVLLGDMSLIGPRPLMLTENLLYESLWPDHKLRYAVKPGITGLAQSLGHFGSTEDRKKMKFRLDLDIFYIRNWSFFMDMKIIWRTLKRSF